MTPPAEIVLRTGLAASVLGAVVVAASALWLMRILWLRWRLDPSFSPLARRRALVSGSFGILLLLAGGGFAWLGASLRAWDPVRSGEPVGIVRVVEGRLHFESASSERSIDLGPAPRGEIVVVGEVLDFPEWTGWLALPDHHRIRQVEQPGGLLSLSQEGSEPASRPPAGLVDKAWFPGEVRSFTSPALRPRAGAVALGMSSEGGYAAWEYPSGGGR